MVSGVASAPRDIVRSRFGGANATPLAARSGHATPFTDARDSWAENGPKRYVFPYFAHIGTLQKGIGRSGTGNHHDAQEVLNYLQARPFRPFRIRMNSGRTFDVRHPEMVKVGRRDILIFSFVSDAAEVYDHWDNISLLLIESISPLEAPVA